ncbi:MAG: hypothetical protein ACOCV4_01845 [Myxococcota bacterium]
MNFKRTIPRVAAASLALGGIGCGDDNGGGDVGSAARNYCEKLADCYGFDAEDCVGDYEYEGPYYTTACRDAATTFLHCMGRQACGEFYDALYDACYDEYEAFYDTCEL